MIGRDDEKRRIASDGAAEGPTERDFVLFLAIDSIAAALNVDSLHRKQLANVDHQRTVALTAVKRCFKLHQIAVFLGIVAHYVQISR